MTKQEREKLTALVAHFENTALHAVDASERAAKDGQGGRYGQLQQRASAYSDAAEKLSALITGQN